MTPDTACVIVAFHRLALLRRLLERLAHPRLEVIVVNVEDDAEVARVQGATVLPTSSNVGYAAGVNLGGARASSDVVVFMNDDVSLGAAAALEMGDRIRSGRADVVVPLVEGEDGELELADKIPYGLVERMQLRAAPVPVEPTPIDAAWAPIVAVRAELLRQVPMPEDYFLYGEELEWFFRLRQRDARVELLPSVRVLHFGGTKVVRADKSRLMARNSVRCVRRIAGRGAALAVWPRVIAWQLRLLLGSVLRRQGREVSRAHAAGVLAAVAAWREL